MKVWLIGETSQKPGCPRLGRLPGHPDTLPLIISCTGSQWVSRAGQAISSGRARVPQEAHGLAKENKSCPVRALTTAFICGSAAMDWFPHPLALQGTTVDASEVQVPVHGFSQTGSR